MFTTNASQDVFRAGRTLPLLLGGLLLASCGGGYQAPVSEQGRAQILNPPEILSSTAGTGRNSAQPSSSRPVFETSTPQPNARVEVSTARPAPSTASGISRRSLGSTPAEPSESASRSSIARSSRPATNSAGSGSGLGSLNPVKHIVSAGDTLFSIAFQYDLDFRSLALANGLNPPYTIFVGQDINLALEATNALMDTVGSAAGRLIENNGVASTRSTIGNNNGVLRQPIANTPAQINWDWPHRGRVLRGFQADVSKGIDIAGNVGDPVLAAGAGDVVYSGRGVQGTGNLIIIRHSDSLLSAYAHNSAMLVPEGGQVVAGQKIAEVGVNAAGEPMLHFEIRKDGLSVDPTQYLPLR